MMDFDYIDVAIITGVFAVGFFLASVMRRLYVGGRHDMHGPARH